MDKIVVGAAPESDAKHTSIITNLMQYAVMTCVLHLCFYRIYRGLRHYNNRYTANFSGYTMEKQKHKPEEALMRAIGFTETDLAVNRLGRIASQQRKYLNTKRNIGILGAFLAGFCFVTIWFGPNITVLLLIVGAMMIYAAYRTILLEADFEGYSRIH